MDKGHAIEQGVLNGRLGDSATAADAELFAIFALLRKVQAQQDMGHYGNEKARVLIMSDCLSGLRILREGMDGKKEHIQETTKWSGTRSHHECKGKPGKGDLHVDPVTCRDHSKCNSRQHSGLGTGGNTGRDGHRVDQQASQEQTNYLQQE
eukprot:6207998-Pleurochrysis_carterae.AAC.1